ncbi:hypothetical protein GA0115246_108391, partial [Streptomyces sp. SolWspMP-sol7th]
MRGAGIAEGPYGSSVRALGHGLTQPLRFQRGLSSRRGAKDEPRAPVVTTAVGAVARAPVVAVVRAVAGAAVLRAARVALAAAVAVEAAPATVVAALE